ncbi:MAG TPA: phenylacetate--CoA ligase [Spirochaetia bacterium]|nr:phenylacetate--CoA ligase [Spirochaetia bacterium]
MIWNEDFETMKTTEREQVQLERLQATVNRALRNVAFYRESFARAGVTGDEVRSRAHLVRLPFTTKEDLRTSYPYGMFAVPLRDIVRIHSTSGTTGTPVIVGYTRNDLKTWAECVARLLAAGGMTEHDVMQVAFTYGLFSGGFGLHAGAERVGASVIPASAGGLEKQVRTIRDFKTTALACTPSYASAIAGAMTEAGLSREQHSLRVGFFGAEPWSEGLRARLESSLGITALDNYGLTEVLGPGISFECERREGLHVNEDHFVAEVVDPATGEVRADGIDGELVLTTITKEGFPVIRYRTGDLCSLTREPCPCGRTFARMSRIQGRIDDLIIMGAVKVFPSQIEQVILDVEGATPDYQIVVDRAGGTDSLEIRVEMAGPAPAITQRISRKLGALLDTPVTVTPVPPLALARPEGGKVRRVVDKRPV